MTVTLSGTAIELRGDCGVEEAEELLTVLEANPQLPVSLKHAGQIHTALWQLIILSGCDLQGEPSSDFAARHLLPALKNRKVK
ncbi:hypothetical protein [Ensifer canadensis]